MKITLHRNHTVTIKLTPTLTYKLSVRKDVTPELLSHLKLHQRDAEVMEWLYPHPDYANPAALRKALEEALHGRPMMGLTILGLDPYSYAANKAGISRQAAKELMISASFKPENMVSADFGAVEARIFCVATNAKASPSDTKEKEYFLSMLQGKRTEENNIYARFGTRWTGSTNFYNNGQPWSEDSVYTLQEHILNRGYINIPLLVNDLGRTPVAIIAKALNLHINFDWKRTWSTVK